MAVPRLQSPRDGGIADPKAETPDTTTVFICLYGQFTGDIWHTAAADILSRYVPKHNASGAEDPFPGVVFRTCLTVSGYDRNLANGKLLRDASGKLPKSRQLYPKEEAIFQEPKPRSQTEEELTKQETTSDDMVLADVGETHAPADDQDNGSDPDGSRLDNGEGKSEETEDKKPAASITKPAATNAKPAASTTKPAVTNVKPAAANVKPAGINAKPAVDTAISTTSTTEPVTETPKPKVPKVYKPTMSGKELVSVSRGRDSWKFFESIGRGSALVLVPRQGGDGGPSRMNYHLTYQECLDAARTQDEANLRTQGASTFDSHALQLVLKSWSVEQSGWPADRGTIKEPYLIHLLMSTTIVMQQIKYLGVQTACHILGYELSGAAASERGIARGIKPSQQDVQARAWHKVGELADLIRSLRKEFTNMSLGSGSGSKTPSSEGHSDKDDGDLNAPDAKRQKTVPTLQPFKGVLIFNFRMGDVNTQHDSNASLLREVKIAAAAQGLVTIVVPQGSKQQWTDAKAEDGTLPSDEGTIGRYAKWHLFDLLEIETDGSKLDGRVKACFWYYVAMYLQKDSVVHVANSDLEDARLVHGFIGGRSGSTDLPAFVGMNAFSWEEPLWTATKKPTNENKKWQTQYYTKQFPQMLRLINEYPIMRVGYLDPASLQLVPVEKPAAKAPARSRANPTAKTPARSRTQSPAKSAAKKPAAKTPANAQVNAADPNNNSATGNQPSEEVKAKKVRVRRKYTGFNPNDTILQDWLKGKPKRPFDQQQGVSTAEEAHFAEILPANLDVDTIKFMYEYTNTKVVTVDKTRGLGYRSGTEKKFLLYKDAAARATYMKNRVEGSSEVPAGDTPVSIHLDYIDGFIKVVEAKEKALTAGPMPSKM